MRSRQASRPILTYNKMWQTRTMNGWMLAGALAVSLALWAGVVWLILYVAEWLDQ